MRPMPRDVNSSSRPLPSAMRQTLERIAAVVSLLIVLVMAGWSLYALYSVAVSASWKDTLSIAMPQMHRLFLFGLSFFFAAAIWREMTLPRFATLIVCTAILIEQNAFEYGLHPWAISLGLHPLLWLGYQPRDINPQWIKLIIAMPFAAYAAVMVFRKSWRTTDRIFLLLMATVTVSTIVLFHIVIDKGITAPSFYGLKARVEDGLAADPSDFRRLCERWDADCFVVPRGPLENVSFTTPLDTKRPPSAAESHWFSQVNEVLGKQEKAVHVGLTSDNDGTVSPPKLLLAVRYLGDKVYGVSVRRWSEDITMRSQAWFCFLSICAHSVWIFGGMFLLLWHKWRLVPKMTSDPHAYY